MNRKLSAGVSAKGLFQPGCFIFRQGRREVEGALVTEVDSGMFGKLQVYQTGE